MRHESRDPAVPIKKRANPQKAMMHCANRLDLSLPRQWRRRVGALEAMEEAR